jgi:aminomethyltransferase
MIVKKTPLHALHKRLRARMVEFAGWEMPLQYEGVVAEHMAVRTAAGVFDVSHMGKIFLEGRGALAQIQRLASNDASRLAPGRAQYSALTTEQGTVVDDVLVHKISDEEFFLCVNAATTDKDFAWMKEHASSRVEVVDRSADFAQIAVQGPRAAGALQALTEHPLSEVGAYRFTRADVADAPCLLARTGYTGEDGFEIYVAPEKAESVWSAVMEAGKELGAKACGLAARDTLRLEAGMPLYGSDMDETTTLLEAGLEGIVKWDKGDFLGRDALEEQKAEGVRRKRVAFEVLERGIARRGYDVLWRGEKFSHVTSGTYAPFLKKAIGMTYLPAEAAPSGAEFQIDIRGRRAGARVIEGPPYKSSPARAGNTHEEHLT